MNVTYNIYKHLLYNSKYRTTFRMYILIFIKNMGHKVYDKSTTCRSIKNNNIVYILYNQLRYYHLDLTIR